jgi:hypothetical protein
MILERQNEAADAIGGDRRQDRRYGIQLDVKWKLIRRRRVLDSGIGNTVDLSSGGLMFDAGRFLPEGLNVELSITWPVLLHNVAPLQLVVAGRIVRSRGSQVAIRTVQHEFRTAGAPVGHRNVMTMTATPLASPVLASAAVFASFGRML